MQVHPINNQYNNLNFGTVVKVEKETRALIDQFPKAKQVIDSAIQQLEKNGVGDQLYISHCYDNVTGKNGQVILCGWTTSILDGKKYKTWPVGDGRDFLIDNIFNWNTYPEPRIADIIHIYKHAKADEVLESEID